MSLAPEYILDGKWTTMVDESTLNLTVILHGTTQIRSIILHMPLKTPSNPQQRLLPLHPFLHNCLAPNMPRIHCQIHSAHSGRNKPDTPTNQNTRSSTHRHSTSCILVPHHDYARGIHPRPLKSLILSIFTL